MVHQYYLAMTPKEAKVSSKLSYGIRFDTPKGCLLNPEGSRLVFFERQKKSPKNNIKIFTHFFYTNHLGEPAGLKSSSQFNLAEAWDKWHELQKNGWTEVNHSYG